MVVGVVADLDGDRRVRHRQSAQLASRPPLPAAGPTSRRRRPTASAAARSAAERRWRASSSSAARSSKSLELAQPIGGLGVERHHRGQVVAVLASQVLEQLAALADLGQPFGRLVDLLAVERDLRDDVVEFGQQVAQSRACSANGARPSSAPERGRQARLALRRRRRARATAAAAASRCAVASASTDSSASSTCVLVGVVDRRRRRVRRPGSAADRSRGLGPARRRRAPPAPRRSR